ncbi:MAG: hypothetical protein JWO84_620 [Parcubacteria group bacterium]|nr:hypothetical protein [Parcubacteria group bacterium]
MNKNTIIAIVIGFVLLTAAGYFLFVKPAPSTGALSASEPASPEETMFVNLAAQLEPLGFDTSILSDPRFLALVDLHTAVIAEPTGRRDPFAPFGK